MGEEAGYLTRLTPKGFKAEPLPNFEEASASQLVSLLESPSHRRAMEAQRALLRRNLDDLTITPLLALANNQEKPLASRVAAIFTLKQGLHGRATGLLVDLARDSSVREYAIRALTDRLEELEGVPVSPILAGLKDLNPRVRREAAFAVARLGQRNNAGALAPLLGDEDAVVAHTAVQALEIAEGFANSLWHYRSFDSEQPRTDECVSRSAKPA